MGSPFHDAALVDNQDLIRLGDGGEAVGNDEARAPLHQLPEGLLDVDFGPSVHGAGGFVQDQDRRVRQDGPGDGHQLALALGKAGPPLREDRVVPLGKPAKEAVGLSQPVVSKHLRILREANLVAVEPQGQRRLYSINPQPLIELDQWLLPYRQFWAAKLDALEEHLDSAGEENSK